MSSWAASLSWRGGWVQGNASGHGFRFSYDPVTAIDEASATGQTAETFADIHRTTGIPLVTSIWRGLAGMGESLSQVWALAKPIYASGLPAHALERVIAQAPLPRPSLRSEAQTSEAPHHYILWL